MRIRTVFKKSGHISQGNWRTTGDTKNRTEMLDSFDEEHLIILDRKIRKALGGGMRQVGILASCGIFSINNMIERLQEDHDNAKLLATELNKMEEIDINTNKVHTNLMFFNLINDNITCDDFISELLNYQIKYQNVPVVLICIFGYDAYYQCLLIGICREM